MKILELNTFAGIGSTGRIALDIAQYAAGRGDETIIGFGAGNAPPDAEVFAMRIGGKPGRKWHAMLRKFADAEGYGSLAATRRLIAFLKTWKPDVVHLHNLHGCYLNHAMLFRYLKKTNIPVVWTLHDCWPFTGHCAYFDYARCGRWKTQCHHCPQQRSYPTCIGLDGSKRNYRRKGKLFAGLPNLTLVTPCQWLANLLPDSFLRNVPVRVVYNGVDREQFRPRHSDIRTRYNIEAPYVALAVASEWEARKGYAYLAEIANRLSGKCQLVVIGLAQRQIEEMPKNVVALPRTASLRELTQWYNAADCVINPTLEDNMPLVNLEALACGTPVATFATGGCPEAINASCGAVVPKGDVDALAVATLALCAQKHAMQAACFAQAEQFDAQTAAEAYHVLYRELLA